MSAKISLFVIYLLLVLGQRHTQLLAQDLTRFRLGVTTNLAGSRLIGNVSSSELLLRPSFGIAVDKTIKTHVHINGQLIYTTYGDIQRFLNAASGEKYITTYQYLLVPVVLRIGKPYSRVHINVGLQSGYLLAKNFEHVNAPLGGGSISGLVGPRIKNIDFGGVIGLGYTFSRHLQGDFRYYQSITKLFKDYTVVNPVTGTGSIIISGSKTYNQSFSLGLIYYL